VQGATAIGSPPQTNVVHVTTPLCGAARCISIACRSSTPAARRGPQTRCNSSAAWSLPLTIEQVSFRNIRFATFARWVPVDESTQPAQAGPIANSVAYGP
jgi:hypothetical protein